MPDARWWALVLAAGAVCVIAGWWGASGTADLSSQYTWTSVGIIGLIVIGAANGGLLVRAQRSLRQRRGELVLLVEAQPRPPSSDGAIEALVAGTDMTHYHRCGCQLVLGKRVRNASLDRHRRAGRRPCGMCNP